MDGQVYRTAGAAAGPVSVSITTRRNGMGQASPAVEQMQLAHEDRNKAKVIAGAAISRLSPKTALALGFSQSGRALQQQLAGQEGNAFLVARDPLTRTGFHPGTDASFAFRHDLGPVAVTAVSERGKVHNPGLQQMLGQPGYSISSMMLDRTIGRARLSFGASQLKEEKTVLGSHFSSVFSSSGSSSIFLDGTGSLNLARGWGLLASYRRGWTSMPGTGALADKGRLATEAFAFDLSKAGIFAAGDKLAVRAMQPLRVSSGGFDLNVPASYDYATGKTGYEHRFFNLAPTGREIDFELAYGFGLMGGYFDFNTFVRTDPGHVAGMQNDLGAAIRFSLKR
jgi:hypothetical protein